MKLSKKLISLLCASVLSFSLCACFWSEEDSSIPTYSESSQSLESVQSSSPEPDDVVIGGDLQPPKVVTTHSITLRRQNCAKDNGYNPSIAGSTADMQTHKNFDLISLKGTGLLKNDDGTFSLAEKNLNLAFTLNENPESLPRHGDAGWWNWYTNVLSNDTYCGPVCGMPIENEQVGRGLVYICLNYEDNETEKLYECNFLNGMEENTTKNYNLTVNESKKLMSINIVVLYEIHYEHYTNLTWTKSESNWRLDSTIYIK